MIYYRGGWAFTLHRVFRYDGSLLPKSLMVGIWPAAFAGILAHLFPGGSLHFFSTENGILNETEAWGGFSFLVGFLIVFRTSQAYSRFWEGCTASHAMRAEWFDACSSLVAFTKHRYSCHTTRVATKRFKELLIRLTSMLHAAALAELELGEGREEGEGGLWADTYALIDPESMDSESLETIKHAEDRVELLLTWIQQLIVENVDSGVLTVPAPLLSRSFQELANGMVQFHNAMKIAYIPLPFPYAQTCDTLLILHTLVVPMVTSQWVTHSVWAVVFTLIQVLIFWSLNLVALEIENPFGRDLNDMDGQRMQEEINRHLLLLLHPSTERTPRLSQLFDSKTPRELSRTSTFWDVLRAKQRVSITESAQMIGRSPSGSLGTAHDNQDGKDREAHFLGRCSSGSLATVHDNEDENAWRTSASDEELRARLSGSIDGTPVLQPSRSIFSGLRSTTSSMRTMATSMRPISSGRESGEGVRSEDSMGKDSSMRGSQSSNSGDGYPLSDVQARQSSPSKSEEQLPVHLSFRWAEDEAPSHLAALGFPCFMCSGGVTRCTPEVPLACNRCGRSHSLKANRKDDDAGRRSKERWRCTPCGIHFCGDCVRGDTNRSLSPQKLQQQDFANTGILTSKDNNTERV